MNVAGDKPRIVGPWCGEPTSVRGSLWLPDVHPSRVALHLRNRRAVGAAKVRHQDDRLRALVEAVLDRRHGTLDAAKRNAAG